MAEEKDEEQQQLVLQPEQQCSVQQQCQGGQQQQQCQLEQQIEQETEQQQQQHAEEECTGSSAEEKGALSLMEEISPHLNIVMGESDHHPFLLCPPRLATTVHKGHILHQIVQEDWQAARNVERPSHLLP